MTKTTIETRSGKVVEPTRTDLAQAIQALPDGFHDVAIKEVRRGYTPTRYKYYFDHVLPVILLTCGHMIEEFDEDTGAFKPVTTTKQVHEYLKMKYCPKFVRTPHGIIQVPSSTTTLPDGEFYNRYSESILSDFSSIPFNCEFLTHVEWVEIVKFRKNKI